MQVNNYYKKTHRRVTWTILQWRIQGSRGVLWKDGLAESGSGLAENSKKNPPFEILDPPLPPLHFTNCTTCEDTLGCQWGGSDMLDEARTVQCHHYIFSSWTTTRQNVTFTLWFYFHRVMKACNEKHHQRQDDIVQEYASRASVLSDAWQTAGNGRLWHKINAYSNSYFRCAFPTPFVYLYLRQNRDKVYYIPAQAHSKQRDGWLYGHACTNWIATNIMW